MARNFFPLRPARKRRIPPVNPKLFRVFVECAGQGGGKKRGPEHVRAKSPVTESTTATGGIQAARQAARLDQEW
jgi:hypothetical protein